MNKKVLVLIVVVLCLVFGVGVIIYRGSADKSPNATKKDNSKYTVWWSGDKYIGKYEGESKNSKPSGSGVFQSDGFQYEGEWENGLFSGTGTITYEDGRVEVGKFKKGKRNGLCQLCTTDSSYVETRYNSNVPYGNSYIYEDNKIKQVETYSAGELVSDIKKSAVALDSDVIKSKEYVEQYVYVEGKVVFVGMDDKKCYFRIESESAGMVTGSYDNTYGKKEKQAIMPNMQHGDIVKVYGYYKGMNKNRNLNDSPGFGYDYMTIQPVYGEIVKSQPVDLLDVDYETRLENPYLNYYDSCEKTCIVESVFRKGKKFYIKAREKGSNRKEVYYLLYTGAWEEVFCSGQEIDVTGYYEGQYRMLSGTEEYKKQQAEESSDYIGTYEYDIYPAIRVTKIQ